MVGEASIPRKRISAPKTKTGCLTCRTRRVKCDETKPSCLKCSKSGFTCDGYPAFVAYRRPNRQPRKAALLKGDGNKVKSQLQIAPKSCEVGTSPAKGGNGSKEQVQNYPKTNLFQSEIEYRYFRVFCDKVSHSLSGYFELPLWTRSILQTAEQHAFIRHAIIAIGALDTTLVLDISTAGPQSPHSISLTKGNEHRIFALKQYNMAVKGMRQISSEKNNDMRTTVLGILLIICFESLYGNHKTSLAQIRAGLKFLEDWHHKNSSGSDGIGIKSPKPDTVEDEILQEFGRLDLQAVSLEHGPARLRRAVKNCKTSSTSGIPVQFGSPEEARKYLELILRRSAHFCISCWSDDGRILNDSAKREYLAKFSTLPPRSKSGEPNKHFDDYESRPNAEPFGYESANQTSPLLVESHKLHIAECETWSSAFSTLYDARFQASARSYLAITILRLRYISSYTELLCWGKDQSVYDNHLEIYKEIVEHAKTLLVRGYATCVFGLDVGFIPDLYVVAIRCRDRAVRREAINLLLSKSWRECLWNSTLAGNMARAVMEVEEEGMTDDDLTYPPTEKRVSGTALKFDLSGRWGKLTCYLNSVDAHGRAIIKEKHLRW